MLKLLIVDDDDWIREGLKRNIPWEAVGIQVVATASNGKEGWELVQTLRPDLLLTDIRMPFMDGLQLAEQVKSLEPNPKIVFLTGYDDFQYAQKALKLKASDYVLKYEENETILEAVAASGRALLEERHHTEQSRRGGRLMENQFFCELLSGTSSEEWAKKEAGLLGITLQGPLYGVAVIQADGAKRFTKPHAPENHELMLFSVKNICTELYPAGSEGLYFTLYNQRVNLIFQIGPGSKEELNERLALLLEPIRNAIVRYLKIPVRIGIGNPYEGPEWLPVSYNEALSAVQLASGADSSLIYSDEVKFSRGSHQHLIQRITEYIRKHFGREDLALAEIAEEIHMTPAYVSTLFKKYKDMTLTDYLTAVRLEKAKELLAGTNLKGYEVAAQVGYSNSQYFSVLFKRNTGLSPIEFRQQAESNR